MAWMRGVVKRLPDSLQRVLLRQYLVVQICRGRRVAEGEILFLPNLVKEGDIVWDIGANAGEYTFQLSRLVGPGGQVHAFEPLDYNFGTLLLTIKRARLRNVTTHQLALSDQAGKARMSMPSVLEHSLGSFAETGQDCRGCDH
jgi:predicted methyltransferase